MNCVLPCEQSGFTKVKEIGSNEVSEGLRSKSERTTCVS